MTLNLQESVNPQLSGPDSQILNLPNYTAVATVLLE